MLVCSAKPWAAQTVPMAKRRPTSKRTPKVPKQGSSARDVQPLLPGWTKQQQLEFLDPVARMDPLEELRKALELVGIDPSKPAQPDPFLRQEVGLLPAKTDSSEAIALAVAHAADARQIAATKVRTAGEAQQLDAKLRDLVRCTLYLRRNMRLPDGLEDDRRPVIMDGEIISLAGPDDDARSALVTLKLPRMLVDRLRDAVHAMQPTRTMAGIASLGISMVLDALEAQVIRNTGRGFPKRPVDVLAGGRPSRTTATNAAKPPTRTKPSKRA